MDLLTKLEELVLLTVMRLNDKAYGRTIFEEIVKVTGKKMSVGNIYFPLERLTEKGYLLAVKGEPTKKRGGLSKRYYTLSDAGINILKETNEINSCMWDGIVERLDSKLGAKQ